MAPKYSRSFVRCAASQVGFPAKTYWAARMRNDGALLVVTVDIDFPLLSRARLRGRRSRRQWPPHKPPNDHLRMCRDRIEHHSFWRAAHAG